jgi:uncharacterized protein YidB (DUF937 family)
VATVTGATTTDGVGTYPSAVVASFAGDADYSTAANATGTLVVGQAPTTLSSVSGTAMYGGTATLMATLTSTATNQPLSGETVTFTLGGATYTAVTNNSGMATLTGATTTAGAGTDTGAVVVSFAGDTDNAMSSGTGNLVVSQAPTAIMNVSGTSPVGGPATLVATLTSTVTNLPISGETVNFTLDGVPVGPAVTDANGVATLAGVPTSDPAGTDPGGVVANFPGDVNYVSSQGTGDLTVS